MLCNPEHHPTVRNFLIGIAVFIYLVAMLYFVNHGGVGQGDYAVAQAENVEFDNLAEEAGWTNIQFDEGMTITEMNLEIEELKAGGTASLSPEQRGQFNDGKVAFETDNKLDYGYGDNETTMTKGDDTEDAFSKKAMFGLAGGAGLLTGYYTIKSICYSKSKWNIVVWAAIMILFLVLGALGASGVGRGGAIALQVVSITVLSLYVVSKSVIIPACQMKYDDGRLETSDGDNAFKQGMATMINFLENGTATLPDKTVEPEANQRLAKEKEYLQAKLDAPNVDRRRLPAMETILTSIKF